MLSSGVDNGVLCADNVVICVDNVVLCLDNVEDERMEQGRVKAHVYLR